MMGEISPSDTSSSFPPVLVGPAEAATLGGARIAAILAELSSSSWRALEVRLEVLVRLCGVQLQTRHSSAQQTIEHLGQNPLREQVGGLELSRTGSGHYPKGFAGWKNGSVGGGVTIQCVQEWRRLFYDRRAGAGGVVQTI